MKYEIPEPPKFLFEDQTTPEQKIIQENTRPLVIEKIDFSDGIKVFYQSIPHPKKGFPTPAATVAINRCKRVFMAALRVFPLRRPSILLGAYNHICYREIPYMKSEYMTPVARELKYFIYVFLIRLKFSEEQSQQFAKIMSHIFEYDPPYRYRLQDLLSDTTKEKLTRKPIREILFLLKRFHRREKYLEVKRKIKLFYPFIFLLLIPKFRKAFQKAVKNSDFESFQFDEDDYFWVKERLDYDFVV